MKTYHVTYFYLATGMEGRADTKDYGFVSADSAQEAKEKVAKVHGKGYEQWLIGCLTAKQV